MHWKDAFARSGRSLVQASFVAAVITVGKEFGTIQWTETQTAAVMAVALPIVSFVQNFIEDAFGQALFYKSNPAQDEKRA